MPTASMNVTPHEWERVVEVLFRKGIVEAIDLEEVFHIGNQPILNGVFAVEKGECRVTRLIYNESRANKCFAKAYGGRPPRVIRIQ